MDEIERLRVVTNRLKELVKEAFDSAYASHPFQWTLDRSWNESSVKKELDNISVQLEEMIGRIAESNLTESQAKEVAEQKKEGA